MTELNTLFQAASQDMYNAQGGAEGGAQPGADFGGQQQQGSNDAKGDVTDVDFEEVK